MANRIIRVVTRAADGNIRTKEFDSFDSIEESHEQIGLDDCSTDLELRGMPIFRGLIGPIPEGKTAVRYESPEVFEALTKEWTKMKAKRRKRRSAKEMAEAAAAEAEAAANAKAATSSMEEAQPASNNVTPAPNFPFGSVAPTPNPSSSMSSI